MTKYYTPKRTRNVHDPASDKPFALGRSREPTNLVITGAIDDLWQDAQRRFVVVDCKATSKAEPIFALRTILDFGSRRRENPMPNGPARFGKGQRSLRSL